MSTPFPSASDGTVPLSHWGVIRAQGADAASFLHGQLTNDVLSLSPGEVRLAGYCSAKGRLLANFIYWKTEAPDGAEDLLLACHRSVLAATLKRLTMFVMRAQCKLSDATAERPLWGLCGLPAAAAVADAAVWSERAHGLLADAATGSVIRLPDVQGLVRAMWVGRSALDTPPPPAGEPVPSGLSLDRWRWLEVASGIPVIEAATAEQFVPQMLNYELIGGVNFQKGCYPGQEIVARSQYRGTTKRRMFLFDAPQADASIALPGTEVFHSSDLDQPAGMVVNTAPGLLPGGPSMLVEVKLAALKEGHLHVGSATGAVLVQNALPYAVPVNAGADVSA